MLRSTHLDSGLGHTLRDDTARPSEDRNASLVCWHSVLSCLAACTHAFRLGQRRLSPAWRSTGIFPIRMCLSGHQSTATEPKGRRPPSLERGRGKRHALATPLALYPSIIRLRYRHLLLPPVVACSLVISYPPRHPVFVDFSR
jgi:hypothetical protein